MVSYLFWSLDFKHLRTTNFGDTFGNKPTTVYGCLFGRCWWIAIPFHHWSPTDFWDSKKSRMNKSTPQSFWLGCLSLGGKFGTICYLNISLSGGWPWLPDGGGGSCLVASRLHDGFTRKLVDWLSSLRWYPESSGGWTEISALELLWQFVFDTGCLPPFWYDGRWRMVDDHTLGGFVVPPVKSLYRVWVRHLVACEALPVGMGGAGGLVALGATFGGFACLGCVPLSPPVVEDLLLLFIRRSGLGALRLPAFWWCAVSGSAAHTSWSAVGSAKRLFAMWESVT